MNLTDHDYTASRAMPDPAKAQQAEYYRLYAEIEEGMTFDPKSPFRPSSRLIHAEVARRMNLKELPCTP